MCEQKNNQTSLNERNCLKENILGHMDNHANQHQKHHCACHSVHSCFDNDTPQYFLIQKSMIIRILASLAIFIIVLIFNPENLFQQPVIAWTVKFLVYATAYLIAAKDIVAQAFQNVLKKHFLDENFLMTIATFGAFLIGEYPEALMVMVLYQIGEIFSSYAVEKSRKSIKNLMKIKPEFANLFTNDGLKKVPPKEVQIGDIIVVRPGEKIPLDGVVIDGYSSIDTSNLTGEALPRTLTTENEALSGCINLDGVLTIQVTRQYCDSMVAKILEMVENVYSKKAKAEKFITKFARIYTPVVVALALALCLIPPFIPSVFDGSFSVWFKRALTFLVISCPCALVISVPLSFFGGIGRASKLGILIKGSSYIEALARVSTVVFDKTGTLTTGEFSVSKICPSSSFQSLLNPSSGPISKRELLKFAAYAENFSNHPIAISLKAAYNKEFGESINSCDIKGLKEIVGKGIIASIFGHQVIIGNASMMQMYSISLPVKDFTSTSLYIAINGVYAGNFIISDTIKPNAKKALNMLKSEAGVKQTVLLTGDSEAAAKKVQVELKIDKIHYNLLPNHKVAELEKLLAGQKSADTLIFVGDGINDAPVLSRADIGIAMGAMGSDAAIDACDAVIMDDNLEKISQAVKISKKTLRIVKQNIIFILAVKLLFLSLGAMGAISMWGAVFADVGVSVLAVLNSLRILFSKNI